MMCTRVFEICEMGWAQACAYLALPPVVSNPNLVLYLLRGMQGGDGGGGDTLKRRPSQPLVSAVVRYADVAVCCGRLGRWCICVLC